MAGFSELLAKRTPEYVRFQIEATDGSIRAMETMLATTPDLGSPEVRAVAEQKLAEARNLRSALQNKLDQMEAQR